MPLILSVRPHGEASALVTVMTLEQGRHAGLFVVEHLPNLGGLCSLAIV